MPATMERPIGFSTIDDVDANLFRALPEASSDEAERIYELLVARHAGLVGWLGLRR